MLFWGKVSANSHLTYSLFILPVTNIVCCLSCRCSSCNLKKKCLSEDEALSSKALSSLQSNSSEKHSHTHKHTHPKYRHVKNTMVQRLSETMVTVSKWRLAIAHPHYSVTCPRRRVMLLSKNPPLKRIPYPFYSVICKDSSGCWETLMLCIWTYCGWI